MRFFTTIVLLGILSSVRAQFIINPSTPFAIGSSTDMVIESTGNVGVYSPVNFGKANVAVHLLGSGNLSSTTLPDTIANLQINSTAGNYTVVGKWNVSHDIDFLQGNLVAPSASTTDQLIYLGGIDFGAKATGAPSATSFVQGPILIQGANGPLTFPIGNATGFFPAKLVSVGASAFLSMECKLGDPSIPPGNLPLDIDSVVTQWYWDLGVQSGNFAGTPIQLSLNNTLTSNEKPVIIEMDAATQSITDLRGSLNNTYVISDKNVSQQGGIYALAYSKDVGIKIHKIITPNGDGINETLVIEGIDFYPINKVTLIDRWGAMYFEKTGFVNYTSTSPQQTDFDYTKLNAGNYICVVECVDTTTKKTIKSKPQMITVLK